MVIYIQKMRQMSSNNNDFDEWWFDEKPLNEAKQECENLLFSSAYDDEQKAQIEKQLWYYHEQELNELKANLLMNQVDRIDAGHNYTQTDIKRKLK